MTPPSFPVRAIGEVQSSLRSLADAPKQGDEGGLDAWILIDPDVAPGLQGLQPGQDLLVLTWLHRARRSDLVVHPRDDPRRPLQGVFGTRSADRPNPIGLHRVTLVALDGHRLRVSPLEAIDQTPVLDLKPVLDHLTER